LLIRPKLNHRDEKIKSAEKELAVLEAKRAELKTNRKRV